MKFIVGGVCGGIAGGVLGAVLSLALLLIYCWVAQPSGNMSSSTWTAGVGSIYFTLVLPIAVALGAMSVATTVVLVQIGRDLTKE